jgi:hypothetical protein
MIEVETVSRTMDYNFILTLLINQEDFIAFSHHEGFRSYSTVMMYRICGFAGLERQSFPHHLD